MAEWSNATDLRSVLFGGAGSNPAGDIERIQTAILFNLKTLTFTQTIVLRYDVKLLLTMNSDKQNNIWFHSSAG